MSFNNPLFVIVCVALYAAESAKLPSFLQPCKKNDPKLADCFLDNFDIIRNQWKGGIESLQIPPLNPLHVKYAVLETPIFKLEFLDADLYHVDEFKINRLEVDVRSDHPYMNIDAFLPMVAVKSGYRVNGKLGNLTLDAADHLVTDYYENQMRFELKMEFIERQDEKYFNLTEFKVDLTPTKITATFDKLFPDDQKLTDDTNAMINRDVKQLFAVCKPALVKAIEDHFRPFIIRFFKKFSVTDLFV